MGIIKAVIASVDSIAADQWKEYFYCSSIPADLIMVRGVKHESAKSANKGNSEVITDGSLIAVNDGQCAIVVSRGQVAAVFKESGENVFKNGESFSIFSGSSLKQLGHDIAYRVSFGGDIPGMVQRVYYVNMKIIPGIEFGSEEGIPFRIVDTERGLDIDCLLEVSGMYAFRVADPEKIYRQVIGNVEHVYRVSALISQMRSDVNSVLMAALGNVSKNLRPGQLGSLIPEIEAAVTEKANETLRELRGIEIVSLAFSTFRLTDADSGMIREIQRNAVFRDPVMAAAMLTGAQADAVQAAAANPSAGPVFALAGMGLLNAMASGRKRVIHYCPECGTKIEGGHYCPECGFKLEL